MKSLFTLIFLTSLSLGAFAQIDTTSYQKERQEIRQLLRSQGPGTNIDCADMIAVGPKGDISFTRQQWIDAQKKEKLVFKSVRPIPGNEFIRIYDGTTAVVNLLINVNILVDGRDLNIKVRRLEVYHKTSGNWCRVAGQGTQVDENLFPVNTNHKP
ncbi:hypothetical protein ACFQZX_16090 [Mucilaginibacter litoreus]|uniref:DUF4440 domain-containing protein n=1 Tax=Mucilaginibacter litoreus TaxID=1048221 RepID=A0ABW3AWG4_9SPHI